MSTKKNSIQAPINELDFGTDAWDSDSGEDEIIKSRKTINKKVNNSVESNVKKFTYIDDDEESDDDNDINPKIRPIKKIINKSDIPIVLTKRPLTDYIFANAETYSFKSWRDCFPNKKVTLRSLIINPAWNDFFDMIENKPYYKRMEEILSSYLESNKETILPHGELAFNSFNVLSPDKIKTVLIGQDPYTDIKKINNKMIPQAMGFSFSVPKNYPKPPSLQNINQNLLTFGHIRKIPDSGCLSYWVAQGCFLINAAFTTFFNKKNAHRTLWEKFTDDLIYYISTRCKNIVFLVWGAFAHKLCLNIDPYIHHIITSSHPSPLGFDKTFSGFVYGKVKNPKDRKQVTYQPFQSVDHFGRTNNYLKSVNKGEILWDLF